MSRRICLWLTASLLLTAALAGSAAAQTFTGTYRAKTAEGDMVLKLQQDAAGKVTGTLVAHAITLQVSGKVDGGKLAGTASLPPLRFFLAGTQEGGNLVLDITEEDENGKPDPGTRERVALAREGGAPAPPAKPAGGGPPRDFLVVGVGGGGGAKNPLAVKADPLVGIYKNDDMNVAVKAAADGYGGTITFGGKDYPFTARKSKDGLAGSFEADGAKFDFTAAVAGGDLKLTTDGVTHTLARQGRTAEAAAPEGPAKPANPLAGTGVAGAGAATGKPEAGPRPADWKVLHHPVGIDMRYPTAWTIQRMQDTGYQLTPPNAGSENGQPTEVYFLMGAQAPGIGRANDPQLIQILEAQVIQLAPFLQRQGEVLDVKVGKDTGAGLAFAGTNPQGKEISARLYVAMVKGFAVCLLELGVKDRIAQRDKEVQSIFATLGASQASLDPRVAGAWRWLETRSGGANNAMQHTSTVGENRASMALQAGGAAQRTEVYQFMANSQSNNTAGEHTGTIHLDTGPQTTRKAGKWFAGEGRLALIWDDDTAEEYNYQVQGAAGARKLVLTSDKGRTEVWGEAGQ